MPIYEYKCQSCGLKMERLMDHSERTMAITCEDCGHTARMVPSQTSFSMLTRKRAQILSKQFGRPIESDHDLRVARQITSVSPQGTTMEMSGREFVRQIDTGEHRPYQLDRKKFKDRGIQIKKRLDEDEEFRHLAMQVGEKSTQEFERIVNDPNQAAHTLVNMPKH